jgi:hypothetical protein
MSSLGGENVMEGDSALPLYSLGNYGIFEAALAALSSRWSVGSVGSAGLILVRNRKRGRWQLDGRWDNMRYVISGPTRAGLVLICALACARPGLGGGNSLGDLRYFTCCDSLW